MKTPPGLGVFVNSALVSLTLVLIASLMLALPAYRLLIPQWPGPIVEQVFPDGRVRLLEPDSVHGVDAIVRSRPLNAARIERTDGESMLGYIVSIRGEGMSSRVPPPVAVWRPPSRECEVAVQRPGAAVEWISCGRIVEVSRPNRMRPMARLRFAFERALARRPGR